MQSRSSKRNVGFFNDEKLNASYLTLQSLTADGSVLIKAEVKQLLVKTDSSGQSVPLLALQMPVSITLMCPSREFIETAVSCKFLLKMNYYSCSSVFSAKLVIYRCFDYVNLL